MEVERGCGDAGGKGVWDDVEVEVERCGSGGEAEG